MAQIAKTVTANGRPYRSRNRRINIFVSLLWPCRHVHYNIYRRRRAREWIRHLDSLIHKAKRKHILKVFYLPSYTPQLNEAEGRINRRVRDEVCGNHQHKTLEELEKAPRTYLRTHNNRHKLTDAT